MGSVRRALPLMAALALGVLGWFAMVPVWTQGLGMVALDADGQPGLWLAAARLALAVAGAVIAVRAAASFFEMPRLKPFLGRVRVLGPGLFIPVVVLFAAMAGQPLRLWHLAAYGEWGSPIVRGSVAFAACAPALFLRTMARAFESLVALAGLAGFAVLAWQLGFRLPVSEGRLVVPAAQEWLVLAFAAGCGLFAAWMAARSSCRCLGEIEEKNGETVSGA